jgi:hypothetical protein
MTIQYFPNEGFKFADKEIKWGDRRNLIRQILTDEYEEHNGTIDNSELFNGDTSFNIEYRQDLYKNYKINYDKDDCVIDLEVHRNADILVAGVLLKFGTNISELLSKFKKLNYLPTTVKEGEFFFEQLKMVIATSESMGGEGDGLDYFYVGANVTHIIDEYSEIMKRIK